MTETEALILALGFLAGIAGVVLGVLANIRLDAIIREKRNTRT